VATPSLSIHSVHASGDASRLLKAHITAPIATMLGLYFRREYSDIQTPDKTIKKKVTKNNTNMTLQKKRRAQTTE
jgi:hypothetical protein